MLLNSAYATLSNLKAKEDYDAGLRAYRSEHATYDGLPVSEWYGPPGMLGVGHRSQKFGRVNACLSMCVYDCV